MGLCIQGVRGVLPLSWDSRQRPHVPLWISPGRKTREGADRRGVPSVWVHCPAFRGQVRDTLALTCLQISIAYGRSERSGAGEMTLQVKAPGWGLSGYTSSLGH